MANTVDPKQYQIYVERQGANYIDYEKITDNANKLLSDEVEQLHLKPDHYILYQSSFQPCLTGQINR